MNDLFKKYGTELKENPYIIDRCIYNDIVLNDKLNLHKYKKITDEKEKYNQIKNEFTEEDRDKEDYLVKIDSRLSELEKNENETRLKKLSKFYKNNLDYLFTSKTSNFIIGYGNSLQLLNYYSFKQSVYKRTQERLRSNQHKKIRYTFVTTIDSENVDYLMTDDLLFDDYKKNDCKYIERELNKYIKDNQQIFKVDNILPYVKCDPDKYYYSTKKLLSLYFENPNFKEKL